MANTSLALFGGRKELPAVERNSLIWTPGEVQVLYIQVAAQAYTAVLEMFERWFENRDDFEIVNNGTSDKQNIHFIAVEFDTVIEQLFLDILDSEDAIIDYTEYSREVD